MPRPRSKKYRDLPEGLYYYNNKGYVFRRIDATWKSLGHDKSKAVSMAKRYNATFRVAKDITHIEETTSPAYMRKQTLFSEFLDRISSRYESDESPTQGTLNDFNNKLIKLRLILGGYVGAAIGLDEVNLVLNEVATNKSNNVYNRWLSFLEKVFSYAVDESVMIDNPAKRKKRKPKDNKQRKRLKLEEYHRIRAIAPSWLKIAMDLSLETTHAVNEICALKYSDIEYLPEPVIDGDWKVYGYIKIHRQKVQKHESSRVIIPVTTSLLNIIEDSKKDGIDSPYIVHRQPQRLSNDISQNCDHITQVNRKYLSRQFSNYRDMAKVKKDVPSTQRPTFHEIRSLSIHLYDESGYDPQVRAAHSDARSTEIYKAGHIQWVKVPPAELGIRTLREHHG
ncbi:tyrosine-type recombinase/integrase [Vibrio fluvialis]